MLSVGGISPLLEVPHHVGVYLYSPVNCNTVLRQLKRIVSLLRPELKLQGVTYSRAILVSRHNPTPYSLALCTIFLDFFLIFNGYEDNGLGRVNHG